MKKTILFFVLFQLIYLTLSSQTPLHLNFNSRNGLPSSEVYDVVQDSLGYMWFSTDQGLARFDGYQFEVFDRMDSLPESAVFYLKFDHYGRLWFNTFGGKLAYYEKGKIYPYKFNERLSQFLVTKHVVFSVFQKFYIEKDGSVIFNLVSIGQYKIDTAGVITKSINDQEDAMLHIDLLPKDQNMIASPLKRSLLNIKITDGKNVNYFDVSQYQNYFKGQLNHVVVNKQEKVYFAEKRVLFLFVADSMKKVVISDFPIGNIGIDKNGNVWVCTQSGGVYVYDENLNFISRYFENETITAFFQDHEGGIWLTSLYSGVFYIPDIQNLVYNLENGLPDLKVINIVSDPEGNIWFACQNNKFGKISGNKVKSYSLNQTGEVIIQKLFYDTFRKRLWIATNYNLFYFQDDKIQVFKILDTIKGLNTGIIGVKEIIQDQRSGELWLGKFRGISKLKMDNSIEELISNGMKFDDRVESLSISKNGELWIGSSRGLYSFSQGKFVGLNEQFPILNERISALLWVNDSLWIGTKGKGLFLLENNKLEQFTSDDGLVSNSIKTLNVSNHTILAGTNKGIVAVSKVNTKGNFLVSHTITTEVGLLSNEITGVAMVGNTSYVSSLGGINVLPDKRAKIYIFQMPLHITNVTFGNDEMDYSQKLEIPFKQNRLFVDYFAISFLKRSKHTYRHRLVGLEEDWMVNQKTSAQYPILPAGNYRFEVEVMNLNKEWSAVPASFSFTIQKPYWQEWWFIVLEVIVSMIGIAMISILFGRLIFKRKKLLSDAIMYQQEALANQMNPHFLFNAMNTLQRYILENDKLESSRYLTKFANMMRMMLANAQKKQISLNDEIEALGRYIELESARFKGRFEHAIICDPNIDQQNVLLPVFLIQPIIENAIWHGLMNSPRFGILSVKFNRKGADLECEVSDNGIGRAAAAAMTSFSEKESLGLAILQKRVSLINTNSKGKISVSYYDLTDTDGNASGTRVLVLFQNYLQT